MQSERFNLKVFYSFEEKRGNILRVAYLFGERHPLRADDAPNICRLSSF